mmetsp:Transcript_6595/g.6722  ORF Transcript_6595/g.6722 Transcript_6595/m.6722 type:complete len:409 (-) Transcript_6595:551-1777(-)
MIEFTKSKIPPVKGIGLKFIVVCVIGAIAYFLFDYSNEDFGIVEGDGEIDAERKKRRSTFLSKGRCVVEICLSDISSAISAIEGGATSIELCCSRAEGGLTPSIGLIEEVVSISKGRDVEVHVLIRPRGGNFVYSRSDFDVIVRDILAARTAGADGIVIGLLLADGSVDEQRMAVVRVLAEGLILTFHRAFDVCSVPTTALEAIIKIGCDRLLTSAQARTALEGHENLKRMIIQSKNRIQIIAASGINSVNAIDIIRNTRVDTETRIAGLHAGSSVHIGSNDESAVDGDAITTDASGLETLRGGYDSVAVNRVESLVNIVNSTFDMNSEGDDPVLKVNNPIEKENDQVFQVSKGSSDDLDDSTDGIVLLKSKEKRIESDAKEFKSMDESNYVHVDIDSPRRKKKSWFF